ncbi:hypothetical protein B0H34DRAFT_682178 [Crassisporium funariophilum]|nr:hypothetical protein B0H34DRAFT_682178 [Crassisporium funariophilum]
MYEKLVNPSEFSSSLPPLKALHDALAAGTCKFVVLTSAEKKEREAAYMAKIASGDVELRKRKRRSDAGIRKRLKRAWKGHLQNGADNEEDDDDKDDSADDALYAPESVETIVNSDAE